MKKRFWKVSNLLLTSLITALGFNSCYVQKKTSHLDDSAIDESAISGSNTIVKAAQDSDTIAKPNLDNIVIVYGPPALGSDNDRTWEEKINDPNFVYDVVENMPYFPDNYEWIQKNLRYPEDARQKNIKGRVIVQFIVERDGSISTPKVVRSVHPSLDMEALNLLQRMPKWRPGTQNGIKVRVRYILPIIFTLPTNP